MQISDGVIYPGQPCFLHDFHNYSYCTQPHLIIADFYYGQIALLLMQTASSSLSFMRKTRLLSLKWLFDQKLRFQKQEASVPKGTKNYNNLLVEK